MDTFMDKLAQKLNAQEMIRANSAAEAEELDKLRNQIVQYNNCLAKLQKLLDDGAKKLDGAQVDGAQIDRLVSESIAKISEMQQDTRSIESMKALLEELKASLEAALQEQKASFAGGVEKQETMLKAALEEQQAAAQELKQSVAALEEQQAALGGKLDQSNENVHKECVKVYRNVQAVILEENGKQTEKLETAVNALKGKLNAVLGVSITAMILALAGVVLQVMNMMNFF